MVDFTTLKTLISFIIISFLLEYRYNATPEATHLQSHHLVFIGIQVWAPRLPRETEGRLMRVIGTHCNLPRSRITQSQKVCLPFCTENYQKRTVQPSPGGMMTPNVLFIALRLFLTVTWKSRLGNFSGTKISHVTLGGNLLHQDTV